MEPEFWDDLHTQILKSLPTNQFEIANDCRADFWDVLPFRNFIKFLNSQLAVVYNVTKKYHYQIWL